MVTQTFGDMLFCPNSNDMKELPSPESLKRRIILSTKPPKEYLEAKMLFEEDERGTDLKHESDDDEKEMDHVQLQDHNEDELKLQLSLVPEYRRLIAIRGGKLKGSLKNALEVDPENVERLSLSEQAFEKAAKANGEDIIRFTQRNLLRIYPKGIRINSSNYNPFVAWTHGAQMVAFNMQGYGGSLWLMHGFFKANGGCGYVKKPDFLMKAEEIFNPNALLPVKMTLQVTVYMGDGWRHDFKKTYFDKYSPPDFYVKVGVAGVHSDRTVMLRTRVEVDEWTPVWGEEFRFPLRVPELAVLRIKVYEYDLSEKDDFAGQTCLPVWELMPGIRAVPLFDRKGVKLKSVRLLMRFQFITASPITPL